MKNKVLESLQRSQVQLDQQRLVSRLTEGLLLQTRMDPHGTALVCWMTELPARNHREALTLWVRGQLASLDMQLGHRLIHPLRGQLWQLFAGIQEGDA